MKREFRDKFLKLRMSLPESDVSARSRQICSQIAGWPNIMQYQRVALYRSFRKEVDLHDLIAFLPRHSFYYPLVDSKTKLMEFYPYLGEDGFKTNAWGLSEPERVGKPLVPEASDLIVVPAIAFDQQGHRLGYGQGYYDRFLAGRNCATLGICLSEFLVETLPSEPHDQRVNAVMTELGLCLCHCP